MQPERLFEPKLHPKRFDAVTRPEIRPRYLGEPIFEPVLRGPALEFEMAFQWSRLFARPRTNLALLIPGGEIRIRFFIADDCHPQTLNVLKTRAEAAGLELRVQTRGALSVDDDTCGVLVQYPTTYGEVEDYAALAERVHEGGALLVVSGAGGIPAMLVLLVATLGFTLGTCGLLLAIRDGRERLVAIAGTLFSAAYPGYLLAGMPWSS